MGKYLLSPIQIQAASGLAMGENNIQVAKVAKVAPQTISVWKQNHEFIALINELKLTPLKESQDRLRALATPAVEVMARIMKESDNDKLKLDAAKYILDTIRISPSKDMGLWNIGPTTQEGVIEEQLDKENPLRSILNFDSNL